MSSTQLSTIDSQFAISTLPKSKSLASSSKIESLYEIEYIPGDRLPETTLPLVNPYEIFTKKPSLFSVKGVTQIIKPSATKKVKEYVQSSKFSSCQIPATEEEQFISLNIPENLPRIWLQEGFTHLHYGVVRIGLTLHARKGLPVTARIALVDSRLKTYQHACIGTVQTTLNAGTVFVTLFPNFNISLKDPNLLKALKVQLQIVGAPMQENSVVATLHHQIVYRIQDHALDLVLPSSNEALFLEVSSASQAPSSIQIPRQISREELLQKLPVSWVTSYERLHQSTQTPIHSTEARFLPRSDGTTEIKFEPPRSSSAQKPLFTQFMMELPNTEGPYREQIPKPISFGQDGSILFPFQDKNGHKYFDIDCDCSACLEDEYESEDEIRQRRRKKKDKLYKRYLEGDPTVGPLGEGNGRYEFIVSYGDMKQTQSIPEQMMFSPSDFPPIGDFNKNGVEHCPKIIPTAINPSGPERLSQGEKVLNWQSENALAQNRMLTTINNKVDQLAIENKRRILTLQEAIKEIHEKVNVLHHEMLSMAKNMLLNTSTFQNKEAEMKNLKNQLRDLQAMQQKKSTDPFVTTLFGNMPSWSHQHSSQQGFLSGDSSQQSPLPQHGFLSNDEVYTSRYAMPSLPEFQSKTQKSKKYKAPDMTSHPSKKPSFSSSSSQDSKEENLRPDANKDIGVIEFSMTNLLDTLAEQARHKNQPPASALSTQPSEPPQIPNISHMSDDSTTESFDGDTSDDTSDNATSKQLQFAVGESSQQYKEEPVYSSDEEMKYQTQEEKTTKKYASKVLVFTFDDIPFSKWNSRIDEFHAWMTSEALTTPTDQVIQQFTARLSGALKEWWTSLGDYRQMLVLRTSIPALLGEIHREFIGTPNHLKDQTREEFFKAKCCSMNRKDLAKHFERQTKRYYALDGLNNPSLKHIYLASIDEYLGQQTIAYIKDQGANVEEISIGQIQQYVFKTLDKLCKQKEFWSEFIDKTRSISKVCTRPDLYIKCSKTKGSCSCRTKKKKHYRRFRDDRRNKFTKFKRKRFFRRKRGFKKSTRCFLCQKEGHYAKNCPNKSKKKRQYLMHSIAKIAPELDLEHHDLESVLSYDSDDDNAICGYSDSEEEYSDTSASSNEECYKITHCPEPNVQTPHLPVTISDPNDDIPAIQAIAFIDTGAHTSIMNPKTLPEHMWLPYQQEFRVANASSLVIRLKSKPIIIEIFPGCQITTQVLGSSAPGKDLILGWDSYSILKKRFNISIEPGGIQWKSHYKAFTAIPRLFIMEGIISEEMEEIRQNLTTNSCADSHKEFLQKCNSPLWLNPQFFVALPFKENINTTPTKASHAGMSPYLLQQANEECDQLMKQGLVAETNSPWACKAFYVNNRAEQARGKLRLVIDYKPLNQFLQDVKFPLPTRKSLLQSLSGAKIFSKFDLKSGFWQLGIQPEEQYKTAFCLPNRHLQWRVLPFGLKTAPSLFQQAMLKIFKPILHTALIYIDDILLFSKKEEDHIQTLRQFQQIVQDYGIMLSARKMILAQPNIEFLGVHITEGQFAPQAHLATELLGFPEENLTKRQVQQFLGVINYLGDFIPNLSKLTQPLRKMLTKNPPPWKKRQTEAVQELKAAIQKLPPLKIPDKGLRVVQTDASDKYWGAVLFEENEGKRQICGYKSGRFKDSEIHYHSTFKEILAVKKAIEKFEFHLIGQKFRIEMDMSSFPKMLQFKQKMVPHQQLLRWSEWFSKYDFEAVYLKGTKNVLADMLSRKPPSSSILPTINMVTTPQESLFDFTNNMPEDAKELIKKEKLHEESKRRVYHYQSIIIRRYGLINTFIQPLGIHPNFPFAHLYRIQDINMPDEVLCFLWYLCSIFTIGIILDIPMIYHYLNRKTSFDKPECLHTFLLWFASSSSWKSKLLKKLKRKEKSTHSPNKNHALPNPQSNPHTIYLFHRPITIHPNTKKIHAMTSLFYYNTYEYGLYPDIVPKDNEIFEGFQAHIFQVNNITQPYPIPYEGKWNFYPITYLWDLDEDIDFHKDDQELPHHAHPAGYSQDDDTSTMDIDKTINTFKINSPNQDPSDSYPNHSAICASPNPQDNFDDYIEEYTCPDNGYGCCEEHMLEFEMDH